MKKKTSEMSDDLRPEYNFDELTIVARGPGRNVKGYTVVLEPDVARLFPTSEAVNEALRLLARAATQTGLEIKP